MNVIARLEIEPVYFCCITGFIWRYLYVKIRTPLWRNFMIVVCERERTVIFDTISFWPTFRYTYSEYCFFLLLWLGADKWAVLSPKGHQPTSGWHPRQRDMITWLTAFPGWLTDWPLKLKNFRHYMLSRRSHIFYWHNSRESFPLFLVYLKTLLDKLFNEILDSRMSKVNI